MLRFCLVFDSDDHLNGYERYCLVIESSNNQKLMLEYEKYQDLQAKTQKTQEEYERQITELENRKEEEVTRQRMQYTAQLEKLKNDLILEREKNKQQSRDHEETKRQIEEDADEEILKLMQTHEQALIECKEENVNLRNKSTTFQRKVCLKRSLIEEEV